MAWNNSLISIPGTSIKAVNLNTLPPEAWNILSGTGDGNEREVRDIYGSVATVFRGVDLRANALVKMPWQIRRTNGEDALWEAGQPCPPDLVWCKNLAQLLKLTAASRTLVSEAFWFIERNRARPLALRWWSPLAVRPHWDERAGLIYFERSANQGIQRYDVADLCYIWDVHPLHETEVKPSPAQAALAAANVLYNVDKLASNYFERGAIRATLLAVSGATSREEKERIQSWWQRVTAGVKNAFSAHVINSDSVTPVQIGDGLAELNSAELNMDKRHDVAVALGIPFSMLFADAANYATAQQDELNFYNSTVIPEAETIAEQLNEQLFNRYGYHFEWLPETMDVFQQDENTRAQAFAQYAGAGLPLSLAAEMLGLELPAGWEYAMLDETPEPQTITVIPQEMTQRQPAQIPMMDDSPDDEDEDDRKAIDADKLRRWLKRNPNRLARLDDFESPALTPADKAAIAAEFTGDGAAEDTPFFVTLPTDGRITPDWWRATKATLGLDPNNPEAEQAARMAVERRASGAMARSLEEWLTEALDGLSEAEVQSLAWRLRNGQATFRDVLQRALVQSADLGVSVAFDQFDTIGYGFDYTLVNAGARDWARRYTDDVLRQLNTTNDRIVGEAVARWIDNGEPLSALEMDLRQHFGKVRAQRIAATEVTRAYAEANRIAYEESGVVDLVEWRTAADELVCPICGPLAGKQSSVKNPQFGTGIGVPPAHVNCRCWIVPVVAEVGETWAATTQGSVYPTAQPEIKYFRPAIFDELDQLPDPDDWRSLITDLRGRPNDKVTLIGREYRRVVSDYIDRNRIASLQIQDHGMRSAKTMHGFSMDGVTVRYTAKNKNAAIDSIISWYGENKRSGASIPSRVWESNRTLYFVSEANKHDAYWAKQYNMPGFKSLATGGDGGIMVYGGDIIDVGSYAHEAGHTFGSALWGNTTPPPTSAYRKIIDAGTELPVSRYATAAPAEDFAESIRVYVEVKGKFSTNHPQRYAEIERLLMWGHDDTAN